MCVKIKKRNFRCVNILIANIENVLPSGEYFYIDTDVDTQNKKSDVLLSHLAIELGDTVLVLSGCNLLFPIGRADTFVIT